MIGGALPSLQPEQEFADLFLSLSGRALGWHPAAGVAGRFGSAELDLSFALAILASLHYESFPKFTGSTESVNCKVSLQCHE